MKFDVNPSYCAVKFVADQFMQVRKRKNLVIYISICSYYIACNLLGLALQIKAHQIDVKFEFGNHYVKVTKGLKDHIIISTVCIVSNKNTHMYCYNCENKHSEKSNF